MASQSVALYARISTTHQDTEMQLRELRQFAEHRGWQIVGEYVDSVSGAKDRRPALDRLMNDAHRRRFDVVVVWKFDRFARSVSHLLRALEQFRALGIDFAFFSEQMDTSTPAGTIRLPFSAAIGSNSPPSCGRGLISRSVFVSLAGT
jgi:DNA invertase Pin-like site-specific DNA recombinase